MNASRLTRRIRVWWDGAAQAVGAGAAGGGRGGVQRGAAPHRHFVTWLARGGWTRLAGAVDLRCNAASMWMGSN